MADECNLIGVSGNESMDSQDSVTLTYQAFYDGTIPSNFYTALARARAAGLPARRTIYSSPSAILVASRFSASLAFNQSERRVVQWTVEFTPPPVSEGQNPTVSQIENPLARPPVFNVEYMDIERVLEKAKNVEELSHGDGKGGNRAAGVEGPIVNAAGKRPDEPIVVTKRHEVLIIKKNFATLAEIVNLNRDYAGTTNSGTVQGYSARQLEYQLTESEGQRYENGIEFWPGITTILAKDTTDLQLDNVGYDYWDTDKNDWVRVKDAEGNDVAEPINLKLDGGKGGDNTTTITYRYLEPKSYGPLFT